MFANQRKLRLSGLHPLKIYLCMIRSMFAIFLFSLKGFAKLIEEKNSFHFPSETEMNFMIRFIWKTQNALMNITL
ncbi:hypothetical protein SAMN04488127_1461 [Bhargavaea ginsengi]|uniref:Uncharacterized protein n=1 Tax=Bhargavaea ginsengi TaxID=426757 RepID=A0A1H6XDV0_9BACL|nr:hypothetical protein SAMN04488127_1461 [Bhargavaea ginsengi]